MACVAETNPVSMATEVTPGGTAGSRLASGLALSPAV